MKQIPKRSEVPTALTWDLTTIFPDEAAFKTAIAAIKAQITVVAGLKGQLAQSGVALYRVTTAVFDLNRQLERVYVYASLNNDQDTGNAAAQALMGQAESLVATVGAATAWFEPEVLALSADQLQTLIDNDPRLADYQHVFDVLGQQRAHTLSVAEEKLLAGASDIFGASAKTYSVLSDADLKFPVVQDEAGNDVRLSEGLYGVLLQSTTPRVRQQAFEALYSVYQQFRHTFAATLASEVKTHNFSAETRHYASARAAAMSRNNVPAVVYDTLVETVNEHLDSLHRYVNLRKEILALPQLHMYDLYTPITGEPSLKYTYQEAQEMALKALAVLGPDYTANVQKMFDGRAIDVVENQGKRTGAYSGGMYDTKPYILLNWQDSLESLFTLVHEMGHSMHSHYTRTNQPYQYGDYSIFVAEIASTTNENLLTDYLLKTQTDPKVRAYVLNHYLDGFKGTVYRQTQFAEFEDYIHQQDAAGETLTADFMSDFYGKLNQRYYGDGVISDPQIADEWTRIPHFYYDYYVYQYATGFAAATTLSQRILSGDEAKRDAYLAYLKAGSSALPLDVMKQAGVDMTQPGYLQTAFATFDERLAEFTQLAHELK
ncbi:oligoendopeptidase F [Levilactobacillus brevis]|uniref:oligoendopeptidase F n=1 Tax=Levilactobacillus TaxID=2767886 RepID=UPI0004647771|nr:oligoendopeptidase F [Levilactobacillus brevis]MBL3536926.1 oligoendopeptidase F [Lactobacillus sp. GPR40-2]MBL3629966.1 oligoendopeptidase F [Lactobacillus sp. GPB7-4]KLE28700.1 oligopeptidase PepB [Levilactobacillus brevis]MBU5275248.1 oligoendopeptidase F [Levilactobacillus brevis]MBX6947798.1 oligoendopeptidase F [Levilactobacillus brevis]